MITEDYVSLETAKLLKEKGFDEECKNAYFNGALVEYTMFGFCLGAELIPCPTLQRAMKWLREVRNLHISISVGLDSDTEQHYFFAPFVHRFKKSGVDYITPFSNDFNTAEEAAEACIRYCLENLI